VILIPGEQVGSAYATIKLDDGPLNSGMSSAHGKFSSFASGLEGRAASAGAAMGKALMVGVAALGVALAGVATLGVKSYMDIESAAADAASKMDLSAIAQKNGTSLSSAFDGVKEHVIAVSRELGQLNTNAFDPTQIAAALAGLAAGGFDVATASAKNLTPILSLATATNYDLASSASMAMATMNQYGLSINDLGTISDVFTQACGDSALGMEDLQYALSYAGPVAKAAGVSLEETTAALEVFSNSGIKGEKAGTALVDVMNTLVAPTSTASKAMAGIGVALKDVDPRTHDFADVLSTLKQKADASGDGLKAFTEIFGVRGGLIYGLAGATKEIDGFEAKLDTSTGAAERMAKLMLNTLKGSFDAAKGAAVDLAIGIGQDLTPTIKAALDWFSSTGAPALRNFYKALTSGDWKKVGDAISSAIKTGWEKLKGLGSQLYGWLRGVNWAGVGSYIVTGIKGVWKELESLGGQLLGYLQGINWNSVGTKAASAFISIGTTLYNAIAGINWTGLVSVIVGYLNTLKDYWTGIATTLYNAFANINWNAVATTITTTISGAIGTLSNIGQRVWDYLANVKWEGVGQTIGNAINTGIDTLKDIGGKIAKFISGHTWGTEGSSLAEKIKSGIGTISGWASSIVKGIKETVKWGPIGEDIGKAIRSGIDTINDYATGIQSSIKTWVDSGSPAALGATAGTLLADAIKTALDIGLWIADELNSAIKSVLSPGGGVSWATLGLDAANEFCKGFVGSIVVALAEGLHSVSTTFTLPSWATFGGKEEEINIGMGDKQLEDIKKYWSGQVTNGKSSSYYSGGSSTGSSGYTPKTYDTSKYSISQTGDKEFRIYDDITKAYMEGTYSTKTAAIEAANRKVGAAKEAATITTTSAKTSSEINVVSARESNVVALQGVGNSVGAFAVGLNGALNRTETSMNTTTLNFKTGVDGAATGFFNTTTSAAQAAASSSQAAAQANAAVQVQASGYAATALRLGAEIGAKFTTDAGQAVRLGGIDGRTAIIGGMNQGAAIGINAANQQASVGINTANQQGSIGMSTATNAASQWNSSAGKISGSADQLATSGAKAATDLATGVGSIVGALGQFAGTLAGMGSSIFGGSGGGGSSGKAINMNGADVNGNFNDMTCLGDTVLVNGLKYTNPQGYTSYINPMTFQENGGISSYQGSGSSSKSSSYSNAGAGVQLPPIFAAKGYLANQGPRAITVGERGTELVLPSDISRTIIDLTASGGAKGQAIQEVHNHIHLNHREIAEQVFRIGAESMQSRGLSIR
jgi:TP901 family phage tail tape measure protein